MSVLCRHCWKYRHLFTSGSATILVCLYQTVWPYSDWVLTNWSVDCKVVWKNCDFDQYLALSPKWCKLEYYERRIKPYPSFWMMPFLMILSDRYPRFQGHDIIERQLNRKRYNIQLYLQWQQSRGERRASGARAPPPTLNERAMPPTLVRTVGR